MGCFSDREKGAVAEEQKWNYITLSDFKSTSCWSSFSFCWLIMLALISVAVYVSDTFTAVQLLTQNSFGAVKPKIDPDVSKWIFTGCIGASFVLLVFEWFRAIRVIRRGSIAETYLDPLAAILLSIRFNRRNEGYRRFLVFASLTKSKKGIDYIAFFVYFQFQGAIRIIFAEGPRQAINAMTLYSFGQHQLVKTNLGDGDADSPAEKFFSNVQFLAQHHRNQAMVLGTMAFSLAIWAITFLSLVIAAFLWLCYLWKHVNDSAGGLKPYCRRKVDRRLDRIVSEKVKKAIAKQDAKWQKQEFQSLKSKGEKPPPGPSSAFHKPTIPDVDGSSVFSADTKSTLTRTDTGLTSTTTLSTQPSRAGNGTPMGGNRGPTLPNIAETPTRPAPARSGTMSSTNTAFSQDAPLLSNAAGMSHNNGSSASITSPMYADPTSPFDSTAGNPNYPPPRSGTSNSNRSAPGGPYGGPPRAFSPVARPGTAPNRQPNYTPINRLPPGGAPRLPPVASSPLAAEVTGAGRSYSPAPSNLSNQYAPPTSNPTPGPGRGPEEYEMGVVSPPPGRMYATPPPGRVGSPYGQPPRVGSPYGGGPPRAGSPYGQPPPNRTASPYGAPRPGPGPGPGPSRMQSPYQPPQYRSADEYGHYSQDSAVPEPLGGQRF